MKGEFGKEKVGMHDSVHAEAGTFEASKLMQSTC